MQFPDYHIVINQNRQLQRLLDWEKIKVIIYGFQPINLKEDTQILGKRMVHLL
jgi:hypothetical protein